MRTVRTVVPPLLLKRVEIACETAPSPLNELILRHGENRPIADVPTAANTTVSFRDAPIGASRIPCRERSCAQRLCAVTEEPMVIPQNGSENAIRDAHYRGRFLDRIPGCAGWIGNEGHVVIVAPPRNSRRPRCLEYPQPRRACGRERHERLRLGYELRQHEFTAVNQPPQPLLDGMDWASGRRWWAVVRPRRSCPTLF